MSTINDLVRFHVSNIDGNVWPSELARHLGLTNISKDRNVRVELVMDKKTGECRGHGYVTVPSREYVNIIGKDGSLFKGKHLHIKTISNAEFSELRRADVEEMEKMSPAKENHQPMETNTEPRHNGGSRYDRGKHNAENDFSFERRGPPTRVPRLDPEPMPVHGRFEPPPPDNHMNKNLLTYRYPLIDVGAILGHSKFRGDLEDVIHKARDVGIECILATAMSVAKALELEKIIQKHPSYIYGIIGVHPHEAKTWDNKTFGALETLASNGWCLAIGETGLDFNRDFSPRNLQLEAFKQQVKLACKLNKPLLLHDRDATEEVIKILSQFQETLPPVLCHCFTGSRETASKYISMGFYIGITGFICRDDGKTGLRSLLEEGDVPLDKIILETDAPFMYPNGRRFRLTNETNRIYEFTNQGRNEPCLLPVLAEVVAEIMEKPAHLIAERSRDNAARFFRLKPK